MGEVEVQVRTFILALDTEWGCLTAPATSPQVPHELEAGRTSEAPSMLWTPQKFVPLPEFEPQFFGHAAHSPAPFKSAVTQCTAQPFMNSKKSRIILPLTLRRLMSYIYIHIWSTHS